MHATRRHAQAIALLQLVTGSTLSAQRGHTRSHRSLISVPKLQVIINSSICLCIWQPGKMPPTPRARLTGAHVGQTVSWCKRLVTRGGVSPRTFVTEDLLGSFECICVTIYQPLGLRSSDIRMLVFNSTFPLARVLL